MSRISAQNTTERQQQTWLSARRKLTEHLRNQVELYLNPQEPGLHEYRIPYQTKLQSGWRPCKKPNLLKAIDETSILLLGDFHGYQGSQKSHLRILRSLKGTRPITIFMECFDESSEIYLEQFLSGEIAEKDFLKAIQWERNWPFPWSHYRPIVQWAQKGRHRIRPWSQWRQKRSLIQRDRWMAATVQTHRLQFPDELVVGIVGELHLTPEYLPKRLKQTAVLVYQDIETTYFSLVKKHQETSVDILRRSSRQFCVITAPPWVKWQSYLMWLEASSDQSLGFEAEPTDHVLKFLRILASDFNVEVSASDLQVYSPGTLPNKYLRNFQIRRWMQSDQSFFLPESNFAYLSRISVNHASFVAGLYLQAKISGLNRNLYRPQDFLRRIWVEALGFFACKMINHKRSADTLEEIRKEASAPNQAKHAQRVLKLALRQRLNEIARSRGLGGRSVTERVGLEGRLRAARLVGFMLGERMYLAFRRRRLNLATILQYFSQDVLHSDFEQFYYEVIRELEPLDRWARDRSERL